jgi:hypothetical protein
VREVRQDQHTHSDCDSSADHDAARVRRFDERVETDPRALPDLDAAKSVQPDSRRISAWGVEGYHL